MWLRGFLTIALLVGCSGTARAEAPVADATELTARVRALERVEPLDDSVRRPLELAKTALGRVRARSEHGDPSGAQRAVELASAALELAEARLRLVRERALFQAAEARRLAVAAERATAERALERERARLRELEQASAP